MIHCIIYEGKYIFRAPSIIALFGFCQNIIISQKDYINMSAGWGKEKQKCGGKYGIINLSVDEGGSIHKKTNV